MERECGCSFLIKNPGLKMAMDSFNDLMDQNHRIFIIGAGCSKCAGLPLMDELTRFILESKELDLATLKIINGIKNNFTGTGVQNIEDYLSELVDMLAIADRRELKGASDATIKIENENYSATQLRSAVENIKSNITKIIDSVDGGLDVHIHQEFVRSIHRPKRPGVPSSLSAVDYLCLNYDTLLEDALALEKISYVDGIDGGPTGWWNPQVFGREDALSRIFKLHGSINWYEMESDHFPRRIPKNLSIQNSDKRNVIIWPASTKYRETQKDPYAQLMNYGRKALSTDCGLEKILIVCGYSYNDSHINIEIDRAVREGKGRLTVVAFTSDDEPSGQLSVWHKDVNIKEQFLIYANKGFFHGEKIVRSEEPLQWWKFEVLTRLIGGNWQ